MHPITLPVDPWLKLLSSTVGRDKVYRTIQYLARFLAYYWTSNPSAVKRLQALSASIGFSRKRNAVVSLNTPIDV